MLYQANNNRKTTKIAIFMSDEMNFKTVISIKDKRDIL